MNNLDIFSALEVTKTKSGVPIVETQMFRILSDMNVSSQYVSDYSNSLHKLMKERGIEVAEEKVLTIFRINPLVAVKIIESCAMIGDIDELAYAIKPLFSVVRGDNFANREANVKMILNKHRVPYVTMLIEAVYQNSIGDSSMWHPDMFLTYAQEEDLKLHRRGIKAKYLNAYNIKHIFTHIPENRQIEFINWFWDKHCYASMTYGKKDSFTGRRVHIMMSELPEGALWQHLENRNIHELSEREQKSLEKEKNEIRHFIKAVVSEGRHIQYIAKILGKEKLSDKIRVLMGDEFFTEYSAAIAKQQEIKKAELISEKKI